jgi:hypothetical protein
VTVTEDKAVGAPLSMEIPQYAIHTDVDTKKYTRVVIIQVEHAGNIDIVGYLDVDHDGLG